MNQLSLTLNPPDNPHFLHRQALAQAHPALFPIAELVGVSEQEVVERMHAGGFEHTVRWLMVVVALQMKAATIH